MAQVVNVLTVEDGGPARHAYELGEALAQTGIDVTTYAWSGSRAGSLSVQGDSARYEFASSYPFGRLLALVKATRTSDILIVHGHYQTSSVAAIAVARLMRKPYILIPHGVFTAYQRTHSTRRKRLFDLAFGNRMLRLSSTIVAASENELRDLPVPKAMSCVLPIGTSIFVTGEQNRDRCAPGETPEVRLLSLSRLAQKKRVDISIRAAAELARLGYPTVLQIAGTGAPHTVKALKHLGDHIEKNNFRLKIEWLGLIDGDVKIQALRTAHFFLLPSDDENFGIGIVEALANGLPAIASSAAAASYLVVNPSRAGSVLKDPHPSAIVHQILPLLTSVGEWRAMSANAVVNARSEASWAAVAQKWISLINDVVTAAGRD